MSINPWDLYYLWCSKFTLSIKDRHDRAPVKVIFSCNFTDLSVNPIQERPCALKLHKAKHDSAFFVRKLSLCLQL